VTTKYDTGDAVGVWGSDVSELYIQPRAAAAVKDRSSYLQLAAVRIRPQSELFRGKKHAAAGYSLRSSHDVTVAPPTAPCMERHGSK
jgi:hypothetical protein